MHYLIEGSTARTSVVSDPPGRVSYEYHWVADEPSMRVEARVASPEPVVEVNAGGWLAGHIRLPLA